MCKDDSKAFIFTLKNPHGVEPTRFMKRKESEYTNACSSEWGPLFCGDSLINSNIAIMDKCNREDNCWINNDGMKGYECHHEYKSSLFVNTNGPDRSNPFTVLDYEVFGIDYENRENINKLCKYPDIIWKYIETKDISNESLELIDDERELLEDLDTIHCNDSKIRVNISNYFLRIPSEFLPHTQIVNYKYNSKLREWAGDYKWRLLYRASEHEYTAKSFHEYCDDKGPTLVIIKSSRGWIFGGYTTQSWAYNKPTQEKRIQLSHLLIYLVIFKEDPEAFIFTLKNPYGVGPTRFRGRYRNSYIACGRQFGPDFSDNCNGDIGIMDKCNREDNCWIYNDGTRGYDCHHEYKASLFVNTSGPDRPNYFTVLDYEVFGIDYENRENINKLCKYPDIIWECIETKDISDESLELIDDERELLEDLDTIHCNDSKIRAKISNIFSKFLPHTQIVNYKYDSKLREWAGDYKWKLLYRASEYDLILQSFHEYCDDKGPTLIIIKSSGGWIFGGYTTRSWSGERIYYV